jgi:hypothetical protein
VVPVAYLVTSFVNGEDTFAKVANQMSTEGVRYSVGKGGILIWKVFVDVLEK